MFKLAPRQKRDATLVNPGSGDVEQVETGGSGKSRETSDAVYGLGLQQRALGFMGGRCVWANLIDLLI